MIEYLKFRICHMCNSRRHMHGHTRLITMPQPRSASTSPLGSPQILASRFIDRGSTSPHCQSIHSLTLSSFPSCTTLVNTSTPLPFATIPSNIPHGTHVLTHFVGLAKLPSHICPFFLFKISCTRSVAKTSSCVPGGLSFPEPASATYFSIADKYLSEGGDMPEY